MEQTDKITKQAAQSTILFQANDISILVFRLLLEYGAVVWEPYQKSDIDKLERLMVQWKPYTSSYETTTNEMRSKTPHNTRQKRESATDHAI